MLQFSMQIFQVSLFKLGGHITDELGLVGCLGFNDPLRQYFSLYRAVSQRGRKKRQKIDKRKNVQTSPPAPTASAIGPCPTIIQISRTPRH